MDYINAKKSNNGFSPFLLIWVFCAIAFTVNLLISEVFEIDLSLLIFISFIIIVPSLYFLDIFLWQAIGKEIISIQDKELIIIKKNRILPRKKRIRFKKIEEIYLWKPKGFFKDIYLMLAFWDLDKQGSICIKYDDGCKYYVGRNLNEVEAEELLEMIKYEIG